MKKLFCLLLCLTLLCCTALPAAAVEDNEITWQEAVQQLKQEETIEELWLPKMAPSFMFKKVTAYTDGANSYAISGYTELMDAKLYLRIAFVPANAEAPRADFSPYFAMCKQKGADLSIDESVWANWSTDDEVSYVQPYKIREGHMSTRTQKYRFNNVKPFEYKGLPALFNGWLFNSYMGSDIQTPSDGMGEIVLPVSDSLWMTVVISRYDDGRWTAEQIADLPGSVLDQLGLTTTGDADLNGQVNAVDGLLTLKHAVQKAEIADELAFALADWDDDGALDAGDALHTLQKAVGKAR